MLPCLYDRSEEGGTASGEYFWQDLYIAQKIFKVNPHRHVDIGSRIDGFTAHVASFREIKVFDIEGLDLAILKLIDWERFRPTCVCVETISYETEQEPHKINEIIELMHKKDYFPYADTFINTIFIDRRQWPNRWDKKAKDCDVDM
jgi:hypothetical protein